MIDPNKFCVAPFLHLTCRSTGEAIPCCYYVNPGSNIKQNGIKNEWKKFDALRSRMLDGSQTDSICEQQCYSRERLGMLSERLGMFHTFGFENNLEKAIERFDADNLWSLPFPKKVELHTSNLCNLKCHTCNPRDSSSLLTEELLLTRQSPDRKSMYHPSELTQSRYQYTDQHLNDIMDQVLDNDVNILDLRGGETMLVPMIEKRLLDLPDSRRQRLGIKVQTNGTVLTDGWKEILRTFKDVKLQLSLDAIGDDLFYIRYPADWEEIQKNLGFIRTLANVELTLGCTVSNLNLPVLHRFIEWADGENLIWLLTVVHTPAMFQPDNLPQQIIESAADNMAKITFRNPVPIVSQKVMTYLSTMRSSQRPDLWSQFCVTIAERDAFRKTNVFDVCPEFREFWVTPPTAAKT